MSIATVLDPRYKMKLINFCFPLIYHDFEYPQHMENVMFILHELFEVYVTAHNFSVLKQSASEQAAIMSIEFPQLDQGIGIMLELLMSFDPLN